MSKVFIDIGHGSPTKNGGATYNDRTESEDCIKLSQRIGELLKAQNIEIKYSRSPDIDPSLSARCTEANNWKADYFVSVHRNACSPNTANGFEAWIYSKSEKNGTNYNNAKKIVDNVCTACGYKNRGVKFGAPSYTDYAVNKNTKMSSVLLECGFIDSDTDNNIFDTKFEEMAIAIAKSLCEIVGVEYKENTIPVTADQKYIVVVGGAMDLTHAQYVQQRLSSKNEKAFISPIGDVNFDGKVTVEDARLILQKSVGK